MTPNEGFAAGIATRSRKERLAWSLKGAPLRKRDLRLTPIGAVAEGRKLRDSITAKMVNSSLDPKDSAVFIAFALPDLSALSPLSAQTLVPIEPDPDKEIQIAAANAANIPVGFVVLVRDEGTGFFGHVRPLLIDVRSLALNEQALRVFLQIAAALFFRNPSN